jgi:hypothetical protein
VAAVIRKQSEDGNLKVEILMERLLGAGFNRVVIAQTNTAYGVVTVMYRPSLVSEIVFPKSDVTLTEPLNDVPFVP